MLQKVFGFDKKKMTLRTEIIAGATTFLTMSYILAVNPAMLSTTGMDKGAIFTATALAAAISTLLLACMAKLPFAQAPGMGLNAFFAFTLVQGMGYSWETALAAMFVEGLIFILITFLNVREIILNSIPVNLRYAISAGIGMFIAFIGLKNAGIIEADPATFVKLGHINAVSLLAVLGILLSGILLLKKVKGALFYSIQVAFYDEGKTQLSVIYQPKLNNSMYVAVLGHGAYLNGKCLKRKCDVKLTSSFYCINSCPSKWTEKIRNINEKLYEYEKQCYVSPKQFKIDSSGVVYTLLANGTIDFLIEPARTKWDYMPGDLLVKESGAKYYNFDNEDFERFYSFSPELDEYLGLTKKDK